MYFVCQNPSVQEDMLAILNFQKYSARRNPRTSRFLWFFIWYRASGRAQECTREGKQADRLGDAPPRPRGRTVEHRLVADSVTHRAAG